MGSLADQVVIVTGAARGIGAAIAERMGSAGAAVVGVDRDPVSADLAHSIQADLTDLSAVAKVVPEVVDQFGRLDVLVNNAGRAAVTPVLEEGHGWELTMLINVGVPLRLSQAAVEVFRKQEPNATGCRGRIVNITSGAAHHGRPLLAAYGASKAALNHLTQSLSHACADDLICCTAVYPGNVLEGMWSGLGPGLAAAEGLTLQEFVERRLAGVPSGRFQEAAEVAQAVHYAATCPGMALNGRGVWSEATVRDL